MRKSVRDAVASLDRSRENLSLLFNRMCPAIDEPAAKEHTQKDAVLAALMQGYTADGYLELYKHALQQWRQTVEQLNDTICFEMEVVSPLIVGKGDQNVHEFGVTLQLPWGTPVIPGSSIKGVVSTFVHEQGDEKWRKGALGPHSGEHSLIMFGGVDEKKKLSAGVVDFLDAWWIPSPAARPFARDIINAHNRSYYQDGKTWPHGMDDPNPVFFVVIKPGEKFFFTLKGNRQWCESAKNISITVAEEYGFGAKTRVGYGRLHYIKSDSDWISELSILSDNEIALLYKTGKNRPELREAIAAEVESRRYSEELAVIFMDIAPQKCMLYDLRNKPPRAWKDVKNIYGNYRKKFQKTGINPADTEIQEIFAMGLPLAPEELPPWFAAFAPSARDLIQGKEADRIVQILHDAVGRQWPVFADFEQAIEDADLDEDEKELLLAEFEELCKKAAE